MIRHCTYCGHWHGDKCQAITHTETGGARRCCCTGQPPPEPTDHQ